jgi:hypothetical protein
MRINLDVFSEKTQLTFSKAVILSVNTLLTMLIEAGRSVDARLIRGGAH